MTTNAPEQLHTTPADPSSPSRLRQAVTTVRTSRPAQAVTTHRKPAAGVFLALAGATTAVLLLLRRKRNTRPQRATWRPPFTRR